ELRELLAKYEFPGDDIPIIRGSALQALESGDPNAPETACIFELIEAIDAYVPTPQRAVERPFLMPVEDVFTLSGRGTGCEGGGGGGGEGGGGGGGRERGRYGGDRGVSGDAADGGDGGGDVSQDFRPRGSGGKYWGVVAGGEARRDRAGAGVSEAGVDHAAHA